MQGWNNLGKTRTKQKSSKESYLFYKHRDDRHLDVPGS